MLSAKLSCSTLRLASQGLRQLSVYGSHGAHSSSPLSLSEAPTRVYPGQLTKEAILSLPSVPSISPSYPQGPYRFLNREYFIVSYETERDALLSLVPVPLVPNAKNIVLYEWIAMPDSSGFGNYQESGVVIPCTYNGEEINYVASMFLDCEPPIGCGRELWGFPKKRANPMMRIDHDTLVGTLEYAGQSLATGTMAFKYQALPKEEAQRALTKKQACLKIIPSIDQGQPQVAQLVAFNLCEVDVIGAWKGPARLHLESSAVAPVAQLPIKRVIEGKHVLANLTLPYGDVLFDYLDTKVQADSAPSASSSSSSTSSESSTPNLFTIEKVRATTSMPAFAPSFPGSHPHITTNQGCTIVYETDSVDSILPHVPENLELLDNEVYLQIGHHEGVGVGAYSRFQLHVPVRVKGTSQRYLHPLFCLADCSNLVTYGREKYGKPFKYGFPSIRVDKDTLLLSVKYGEQEVLRGSMLYKHHKSTSTELLDIVSSPEIFLKVIPASDGKGQQVACLVSSENLDAEVEAVYEGDAALTFFPHVHAPIADIPVKKIIRAFHYHGTWQQKPKELIIDLLKE